LVGKIRVVNEKMGKMKNFCCKKGLHVERSGKMKIFGSKNKVVNGKVWKKVGFLF
jgi:hypothetical protein